MESYSKEDVDTITSRLRQEIKAINGSINKLTDIKVELEKEVSYLENQKSSE